MVDRIEKYSEFAFDLFPPVVVVLKCEGEAEESTAEFSGWIREDFGSFGFVLGLGKSRAEYYAYSALDTTQGVCFCWRVMKHDMETIDVEVAIS